MSYSIWLLTQNKSTQTYLQSLVNSLASKHQGPQFEPHLTMLGDLDLTLDAVNKNCQKLAHQFKPIQVETGPIEYSTTYYQCVFVRIKPNPELMSFYDSTKQSFKLTSSSVFMPHISLLYGDIPYSKRHQIIKSFSFKPQSFLFDLLVVTPGGENPPSEWKHLSEFTLG